jgi:hypothetical protein
MILVQFCTFGDELANSGRVVGHAVGWQEIDLLNEVCGIMATWAFVGTYRE